MREVFYHIFKTFHYNHHLKSVLCYFDVREIAFFRAKKSETHKSLRLETVFSLLAGTHRIRELTTYGTGASKKSSMSLGKT